MDISSIVIQPPADAIVTAYQPVQFAVLADAAVTPAQPMYCDIYFIDVASSPVFYKTITSYTYVNLGGLYGVYNFDIQDALQEYLEGYFIGPNALQIVQASDLLHKYNACRVQCFFRGSDYDANGLLVPNATIPVQGTATTDPVSGTGTGSHVFVAVNATCRPLDARDFETHLANIKALTYTDINDGPVNVWPLSNYPMNTTSSDVRLDLAQNQYDDIHACHPIYVKDFNTIGGLYSATSRSCYMELITYAADGYTQVEWNKFYTNYLNVTEGVWYVPCGIRNIVRNQPTFAAYLRASPYYRVILYNRTLPRQEGDMWISPLYRSNRAKPDTMSLTFQNYHGCLETVHFTRNSEDFKVESSNYYRAMARAYTITSPTYPTTGRRRMNVKAEDITTVWGVFTERQMEWIKELLASPVAFVQVEDPEAALTIPAGVNTMPIVIEDATIETRKDEGRYEYVVSVKFRKSFDYRLIRN